MGASLSVSRSAILAMAVTFIVLFLGWPGRWRLRALALAPLVVVALRVAVPGLVGTLLALFTNLGNDPSVSGRTSDYTVVLRLYADHPWLGRGLYTFLPRNYRILDNQWLTILIELGVVGLLVVAVFLLTAFLSALSAFRRAATARSRHLGLALAAAIAGAAVSMVTYDAWGFPLHAGLSFLMAGLSGAAWRLARADRAEPLVEAPSPRLGKRGEIETAGRGAFLA
jgi:O-antigen ligase